MKYALYSMDETEEGYKYPSLIARAKYEITLRPLDDNQFLIDMDTGEVLL